MDRREAETLAVGLMADHGLLEDGWRFAWNRRKTAFGATVWRRDGRNTVELSGPLVDVNGRDKVENTVRHEIAHVLAGPEAGHGPAWKAACAVTGAEPVRCGDGATVERRWAGRCPSCGEVRARRHKMSDRARGFRCAACVDRARAEGRWSGSVRPLVWEDARQAPVAPVRVAAERVPVPSEGVQVSLF